ncbi:MAG: hypothetical protein ABI488_00335 [Polyangiaceae bacterium]
MQKPISSGLLIVVEQGAEWPSTSQAELVASGRRVFAQEDSEAPAAFAARVGEQIDGLFARGIALGSAVLACSERLDEPARSARADLARAVASAMARATGGWLLLTASDRNDGRSRAALTALHCELAVEWRSAAIENRLRFGDELDVATTPATPKVSSKSSRGRGPGKDGARRVA